MFNEHKYQTKDLKKLTATMKTRMSCNCCNRLITWIVQLTIMSHSIHYCSIVHYITQNACNNISRPIVVHLYTGGLLFTVAHLTNQFSNNICATVLSKTISLQQSNKLRFSIMLSELVRITSRYVTAIAVHLLIYNLSVDQTLWTDHLSQWDYLCKVSVSHWVQFDTTPIHLPSWHRSCHVCRDV